MVVILPAFARRATKETRFPQQAAGRDRTCENQCNPVGIRPNKRRVIGKIKTPCPKHDEVTFYVILPAFVRKRLRCGGKNHRTRNSKARQRVLKKLTVVSLPIGLSCRAGAGLEPAHWRPGNVIPSAFVGVRATRVGETFSCSTAELPCHGMAGAGLEPATTSVRSCSSSGICPQAAHHTNEGAGNAHILYLAELPAGEPAGRDSNPRPCNSLRIWCIAEIRYKLQATCTNPIARSAPTA